MKGSITITIVLSIFICFPAAAQFNAALKKANKQYELHAYNLAIPSYLDAVKRRSDNAEALGKLADCYRHINNMEEAAKYYAQAVKQKDVDKAHILQYGLVLKALGRYDDAKQQFQKFAQVENAMIGNHFAQSCDFAKSQLNVTSSYTLTNELLNTSASDFGPAFFGQQQVVYASARTDITRSSSNWTGKANNQLFLANIGRNGYLESPVFLRGSANNEFNVGPVSFSPDGRVVAYTKNNFVDGTRHIATSGMELNIFIATVNANGDWVNDQPFPYNGTDFSTGFPCFSPDGNALYFASTRPEGFGGYDIYVSKRVGNSWSTPENLGPVVNSPANEVTPYFDGNMLFFSSDWHQGLGGYDIFRAEPTGERWTKIYHLGSSVNSPYDDYGFAYDGFRNIGYLVSNRPGGRGNEDIYRVQRSADYIVIRVKNASDGTGVAGATIDFTSCGEGIYQTDNRGIYGFQAVQGLNCNLTIKKEGYLSSSLQVSTQGGGESREYEVTLSRANEAYAGKVLDYTSRRPLDGVLVTAINQNSGSQTETTTNANGDYYLALSPYASYVLRLSRPGYRDLNFTARTQDGLDRTILGVIAMLPAVGGPADVDDVVRPPVDPGTVSEVGRGYSVQVSAVSNPNMSAFDNLTQLGTVYSKSEGGRYKIRVGVFPTRAEAESALKSVKAKGYKGAFIVEETGGAVTGGDSQIKGKPTTPTTGPSSGRYKVQLAAYRDVRNFDDAKIRNLGTVEERQKGQLTVKYLGSYSTLSEAKQVLSRAKSAGFPDAYVVEETASGELVKVKQ